MVMSQIVLNAIQKSVNMVRIDNLKRIPTIQDVRINKDWGNSNDVFNFDLKRAWIWKSAKWNFP